MDGKNAVIRFSEDHLEVHRKAAEGELLLSSCRRLPCLVYLAQELELPTLQTSIKNVLFAEVKEGHLKLWTLARKKQHLHLVTLEAVVESPTPEDAESDAAWVKALLRAAYGGETHS